MFGKSLTLFTVFGFTVRVNLTWTFLALLIASSLAVGVFPELYEGLPAETYWVMAAVGVVGLFASIVVHELCHSLVARAFGMEMKGITLFLFGGVAEMEEEPPTAKAELLMALAGPAASVVVAGAFYGAGALAAGAGAGPAFAGVLDYLGLLNLVLAVFNMIPAFPLDGGRALRAAIWQFTGDLRQATRWASNAGKVFGTVLMALGVLGALTGNLVGGIWWFLIGMFVRASAQSSFHRLEQRRILEGKPVSRFMTRDPVTVGPDIGVRELVDRYVMTHYHELFPVVGEDGALLGAVGTRQIKEVDHYKWNDLQVRDIYSPRSEENTIGAEEDAVDALSKMNGTDSGRLMVVEGDRLVGIIALKDLMRLLELHMDLDLPAETAAAKR